MRPYLPSLLLAAASVACGQNPSPAPNQQSNAALAAKIASMMGECPVGLTAQQQTNPAAIWTTALEDAGHTQKSGESGVRVQLSATKDKAILQVELRVHYTPSGLRFVPVGPATASAPDSPAPNDTAALGTDSVKTYQLAASDGGSLKLAGDLLVGTVATIKRVSVASIHFADGSTWQANAHQSCSVAINHFIPVSVGR